jgi:sugar-phosphatase
LLTYDLERRRDTCRQQPLRSAKLADRAAVTPNCHMPAPLTLRASAILFDMDGVLVDSRPVVERVWHRWAARHGVDSTTILPFAHGRRPADTIALIAPDLDIPAEVAWLDAEEAHDFAGVVPIPGAAALLPTLPPKRWAIVTSASTQLALARLNVCNLPRPEMLIGSEMISRGKPDPEGYLRGAEALGMQPHDCVVFEDAPPGITAARSAGMRVIGLATTHPRSALLSCEYIVNDLSPVSVRELTDGLEISVSEMGAVL